MRVQPASEEEASAKVSSSIRREEVPTTTTSGTAETDEEHFCLSDAGRPVRVPAAVAVEEEGEVGLACPVCSKTFESGEIRKLEIHVEDHIRNELMCPICDAKFGVDMQTPFEQESIHTCQEK